MASWTCMYSLACSPLGYSKCPARIAPVRRSRPTTSSCVGTRCIVTPKGYCRKAQLVVLGRCRGCRSNSTSPVAGRLSNHETLQGFEDDTVACDWSAEIKPVDLRFGLLVMLMAVLVFGNFTRAFPSLFRPAWRQFHRPLRFTPGRTA